MSETRSGGSNIHQYHLPKGPKGTFDIVSMEVFFTVKHRHTLAVTPTQACIWNLCAQSPFLTLMTLTSIVSLDLSTDLLCFTGAFWSGLQSEFMNSAKSSTSYRPCPATETRTSLCPALWQFSFYAEVFFGVSRFFCILWLQYVGLNLSAQVTSFITCKLTTVMGGCPLTSRSLCLTTITTPPHTHTNTLAQGGS